MHIRGVTHVIQTSPTKSLLSMKKEGSYILNYNAMHLTPAMYPSALPLQLAQPRRPHGTWKALLNAASFRT